MTTNQTAKERIERTAEECGAMILAAEMLEGSIGEDQQIAGRAMGATARRILDILQGKEPEETTNDQ